MKQKFYYKCVTCGQEYHTDKIMYLCPKCQAENEPDLPPKGVLFTLYDYQNLPHDFDSLKQNNFLQLLPIQSLNSLPPLKIGNTPLYQIHSLNDQKLNFNLFVKDDSQNPTFSFKDRASAMVSAFAKEHNIDTIVAASTGNAGSSLAGIAASQKQKAIIYVPKSAPKAKLIQIQMYGAELRAVDGNYDKAFDLSIQATEKYGWYNRNTAYNPITIEGKKTVAFELFDQLRFVPDRIFVPVGDGVILSGVYKGFEDLLKLNIIDHMPTIVAVQAQGSSNLINNVFREFFEYEPSNTLADSISVDIPRNFYMAKHYINKYNGEICQVSDHEILVAMKTLASNTGIFAEPAASAAFAGLLKFMDQNLIEPNSSVVVLSTGSGLKDLKSAEKIL
jgi:threonine synthase